MSNRGTNIANRVVQGLDGAVIVDFVHDPNNPFEVIRRFHTRAKATLPHLQFGV